MRIGILMVQAFLAVNALVGGLLLILAPDGSLLQLPLTFLHTAMFTDFFWPGIILFGVLGLGHVVGFVLTWRRAAPASRAAMVLGLGTLIWIAVQLLLTELFWLQGLIALLALLELLGGRGLRWM